MSIKMLLLALSLVISAIFGISSFYLASLAEQRRQEAEFMENLAVCRDCTVKKPFIGPGSGGREDGR